MLYCFFQIFISDKLKLIEVKILRQSKQYQKNYLNIIVQTTVNVTGMTL